MPVNYSVHFGVNDYINSNAIIKVNFANCTYLGYNYVNIVTRVLQYLSICMSNSHNVFSQSVYVFMWLDQITLL